MKIVTTNINIRAYNIFLLVTFFYVINIILLIKSYFLLVVLPDVGQAKHMHF